MKQLQARDFKGYDRVEGHWIFGSLFVSGCRTYIIPSGSNFDNYGLGLAVLSITEVDPKSVGQFTGIYDDLHNQIYEGDIVEVNPVLVNFKSAYCKRGDLILPENNFIGTVKFYEGSYNVDDDKSAIDLFSETNSIHIIGSSYKI